MDSPDKFCSMPTIYWEWHFLQKKIIFFTLLEWGNNHAKLINFITEIQNLRDCAFNYLFIPM